MGEEVRFNSLLRFVIELNLNWVGVEAWVDHQQSTQFNLLFFSTLKQLFLKRNVRAKST
jgi:hypothetical protein